MFALRAGVLGFVVAARRRPRILQQTELLIASHRIASRGGESEGDGRANERDSNKSFFIATDGTARPEKKY